MKYKGNKALMKCCKSCQNKKRIKCIGQPQIYKYQGYKFCTECTRSDSDIEKSFKSLHAKINLNQRINYYTSSRVSVGIDMTTQSDTSSQIVISKPDIEEIKKATYTLGQRFGNFIKDLKKRMNNYGKSKEV